MFQIVDVMLYMMYIFEILLGTYFQLLNHWIQLIEGTCYICSNLGRDVVIAIRAAYPCATRHPQPRMDLKYWNSTYYSLLPTDLAIHRSSKAYLLKHYISPHLILSHLRSFRTIAFLAFILYHHDDPQRREPQGEERHLRQQL